MKCPECGREMLRHSDPKTTFELDGWICTECMIIIKDSEKVPFRERRGVIIKEFRKAWWEDRGESADYGSKTQ